MFQRIAILGAGAVGGLLSAGMARTGREVTLVERGERLDALRNSGLIVIHPDGRRETASNVRVSGDPRQAGEQDLVVLAVKAYDLPGAAPDVAPLLGDRTVVLPVQNGIPWWYFHAFGGAHEGHRLASVDPEGTVADHIDGGRVLGCVPYVASEVDRSGVVRHLEGEWFPVGEPDGSISDRAAGVVALLEESGFRSRVLDDIRSEIWLKAWGNLSFNPISALTRATMAAICQDPGTRALARRMMEEAQEVAEALGASFRRSIDRRIAGAEAVGEHKTSMLQDLEAGRRLELDALVGSVLELAELTGKSTPTIQAVYALVSRLAAGPAERQRDPEPVGDSRAPGGSSAP